jgi:hypothetical protein
VRARLGSLALPLSAAAAVAFLDRGADGGDIPFFVQSSRTLFSHRLLDTFANRDIQAGPLQLLVLGGVDRLARLVGLPPLQTLAFVAELSALVAVVLAARLLAPPQRRHTAQLVAGLLAVAAGATHSAFVDGHPAQVWIPALWVAAAALARRGNWAAAGAVVGLSSGFELWGMLGAPVLLLGPWRRVAAGWAVQAAVGAALLAPFALGGEFHMFDQVWRVGHGSPLSLLLPLGTVYTWPLRLAQGAVAVAAGGLAAWRLRASVHALWLVPLCASVVRVLLDPVINTWYLVAPEILVVLGAGALAAGGIKSVAWLERRRSSAPTPASSPRATAGSS